MFTVATINDSSQNLIAPSVYIDGVEKENNTYKIHYSLVDNNNSWMNNEDILSNLSVYISDGISTEKRLLNTTIAANQIKNNTVKDYAILFNTASTVTITAWSGNENISSSVVTQSVLLQSNIVKASYNGVTYDYVNKIKDFDILNFINTINLNTGSQVTSSTPLESELLISYNPIKKASLGFIINLEKLFTQKSSFYNILKGNENYKKLILTNSKINDNLSYFSKKNLTKKAKDYTKIANPISASIIDAQTFLYYVGVVDDNTQIDDKSYYDISAHIEFNDFSNEFIGDNIRESLKQAQSFLEKYKNSFIISWNDTSINDPNTFVFENYYEQYTKNIESYINDLSPLCALLSGLSTQKFASLFMSLLHPLMTTPELLNKLTDFTTKLQDTIESISSLTARGDAITKSNVIYDKIFGNSEENIFSADLNYDYDANTGIELLSADSVSDRAKETITPLKELTQTDFESRKILEARKYFSNPSVSTINQINLFSIASFDIKGTSFQSLIGLTQTDVSPYNDVYLSIKEYNDFNFSYKKPETYFFQISKDGINIKTLSNRDNKSINSLQKSTLFDSNRDTKQSSLKFMTDTNIKSLYYVLDNEIFISLENIKDTQHYRAANNDGTGEASVFKYAESYLENPDLKAKTFIYYNNLFSITSLTEANTTDLDIYELQDNKTSCVSDLFTKKLRQFNRFFAVRKATTKPTYVLPVLNLQNDIKLNVPAIYLSRSTTPAKINISTSEL